MLRRSEPGSITAELKHQGTVLGGTTIALWAIEVFNSLTAHFADLLLGIRPHSLSGLWGIFFAPFLHANFMHLAANTVPFLVLGWLIMARERRDFWIVSAIAALAAGLGTWLFGSANTVHVGLSGVIFGYLGFLLLRGYFERSFLSIALSLVVGFFWGSALWGVLPLQAGISWEGHLFGFLGGVLAARLLARPRK